MSGNIHNQDGHDFYRSNSSPLDFVEPLTLGCYINGPDASGTQAGHSWQAPIEAHTCCDASRIFIPKGSGGIAAYTLNSTGFNPAAVWTYNPASISCVSTPAWDPNTNSLWSCWSDGTLRKLNPSTGALIGTYTLGGGSARKTPLLVDNWVFVVGFDGNLHCVSTAGSGTLSATWIYTPTLVTVSNPISGYGHGSTPASYSRSRDVVVYATDDLYVHCLDRATGALKWRIKPTTQTAGGVTNTANWFEGNTFERGWPSISDGHGLVILRLQLAGIPYLQNVPTGNPKNLAFPDLASTKNFLGNNPTYQSFIVMSLDDGSSPTWTPAVLYTYEEASVQGGGQVAQTPHMPVVKRWANGDEVVYTTFRLGVRLSTIGTGATLSESGTTVTVTVNNGLSGIFQPIVEIAAASDSRYNGVWQVTSATATSFTFTHTTAGLPAATGATVYEWPQDWRWDGHMGELLLDSTTVAGFSAGDLRELRFDRLASNVAPGFSGGAGYAHINDESSPLFLAGSTLMRAHWGALEAATLTDRTTAHAGTYADPLPMTKRSIICLNRATPDSGANVTTHATTSNLTLGQTWASGGANDGRFWDGPGFFQYLGATPMPGGDAGPESNLVANFGARCRYAYTTLVGTQVYLILQGDAGEIGIWKPSTTAPTATAVSSISGPASVSRYAPFDVTFNLTTTATEPQLFYDQAPPLGIDPGTGVTADLQLLSPSQTDWSQALVHACALETPVTFTKNTYTDPYGTTRTHYYPNAAGWVCHTPGLSVAGTWTYRVHVVDANGEYTSATATITVS